LRYIRYYFHIDYKPLTTDDAPASLFKDLFSNFSHMQKIISNTTITIETTVELNIMPIIIAVKDMSTDITEYAFDLYNHPKGIKCAPKIIAKTITILFGTVGYTHIAINRYRN
jgi:hypothetical protein